MGFTHPTTLKPALPEQALIERRAAGQFVDLAAHEGIGEGGVAADERLGELVDGLLDEAVDLLGAELLDHVGDGGFLGGLLVDLAGLLLPRWRSGGAGSSSSRRRVSSRLATWGSRS